MLYAYPNAHCIENNQEIGIKNWHRAVTEILVNEMGSGCVGVKRVKLARKGSNCVSQS